MSLRGRLLEQGVKTILAYRSRLGVIESAVRAASRGGPRATVPTPDRVTVASVQLRFELLEGGAAYGKKIYGLAQEAVARGAQVVAFPEYAWTPLMGMLPGIRDLAARAQGGLEGAAKEFGGGSLADILRTVAPAVESAFVATGRAVARALRIYLMSGSTISLENGKLYNTAYLFGPEGELVGRQRKMHAFLTERAWLTVGDSLQVFALPFARVALPVCMDFTYWETTQSAVNRGADLLCNPSADSQGDQEYAAMRGVRARVQESPAYGVLANMVTDLFGLHWRGPSWIVAPLGLDPRGSVLARTATGDTEEVVVTELDLERLREFRAAHPLEPNPELYARYLPAAYAAYRERAVRDGRRKIT